MAPIGSRILESEQGQHGIGLKIMDFRDEMEIYKQTMNLPAERHHPSILFDYPKHRGKAIAAVATSYLEARNEFKKFRTSEPTSSSNQNKPGVLRNGGPSKHREPCVADPHHNKGRENNTPPNKSMAAKPLKRNTPKRSSHTQKHGVNQPVLKKKRSSLPRRPKDTVECYISALGDDPLQVATEVVNKSEATAFETSRYAAKYLPQENTSQAVRLPKTYFTSGSYSKQDTMDDPCCAADAFVDCTDTETQEDKYVGSPFYIGDEEHEMYQSRVVHHTTSTTAEESEMYFTPKSVLSPSLFPNVPPYLNFSSHAKRGPAMPEPLQRVLKWKLSPILPQIVKRVVLNTGFRIIKHTFDWTAVWEKHMRSPGFRTIRSHQKYNHMPGSFRIGRKDTMWRSIAQNVKKFGRKEFGFMQKTYIMPEDFESLRNAWPKCAAKQTKWIVKPPASARGSGIRIVTKWSQFSKDRPLIVQKYIEHPLLVNDSKFDMRLYVVITSIDPLRIYMYKDGLARFAAVKYNPGLKSLDDRCMHLTNYSINKYSQNYSKNEDFNSCQGHKWTLQALWCCLEDRGVNTKRLWATLRNLVIKAILSGEAGLNRMYRQFVNFRYNCFELFGFDVLLDNEIVPWLLEVNVSPSLHSELPLDLHIKGPLIQAVFNTALYQVPPRLNKQQQADIIRDLSLNLEPGQLCLDKRLFTTCLKPMEIRKQGLYTRISVMSREEYLETILDDLTPDDVRCLVITEDELHRCAPLERIFPTPETYQYLKFMEDPRYYNRLLDAWEHRYGHRRADGIEVLTKHCAVQYHLEVSPEATEKEPNDSVTEIDLLRMPKSDDPDSSRYKSAKTIPTNAALPANQPHSYLKDADTKAYT